MDGWHALTLFFVVWVMGVGLRKIVGAAIKADFQGVVRKAAQHSVVRVYARIFK